MKSPIKKAADKSGELTAKELEYVNQADYKNTDIEAEKHRNRNSKPVSYSLTEDDMKIFSRMYEVILRNKQPNEKFPKNSDIMKMALRKLYNINDETQIINLYRDVLKKVKLK